MRRAALWVVCIATVVTFVRLIPWIHEPGTKKLLFGDVRPGSDEETAQKVAWAKVLLIPVFGALFGGFIVIGEMCRKKSEPEGPFRYDDR